MPASVFVGIQGLEQLGERLRLMKSEVSLKIGGQAVNAGAQVIKKLAKAKAPVAPEEVTPDIPYASLRDNIVVKKIKSPLVAEYIVTVRGKRKDFYAARVGRFNEFGTVKMAAQPFMRPAFDEGKSSAATAIIEKLRSGIEKVGG